MKDCTSEIKILLTKSIINLKSFSGLLILEISMTVILFTSVVVLSFVVVSVVVVVPLTIPLGPSPGSFTFDGFAKY